MDSSAFHFLQINFNQRYSQRCPDLASLAYTESPVPL